MESFLESTRKFFEPLSTPQKFLFGLLATIIIGSMAALLLWAARPDYALLFGSLNSQSAQTIVEELKDDGIDYKLENNGTSILVPQNQVHELRLKYASSGNVGQNFTGYELFDSSTLGMTEFMQRVNMKRALEGELSRTITALSQVEFARVHLVLPERSPFQESDVEATASVIVNMKPNQKLKQQQIEGISSLVSGSVQQLSGENVTILDQNGNRLSNNELMSEQFAGSSAQMKVQKNVENYLMNKAQTMLDRVLGTGNSIVRVSTKHDFEQIERESRIIDPDSRIIISEEKKTDRSSTTNGQPIEFDEFTPPALRGETITTSTQTEETDTKVRNYEVNTATETYKKPVGELTQLSASVLLNHQKKILEDVNGRDSVVYTPYSQQQLAEIRDIVASAIGYSPQRGDQLTVSQFRFDDTRQDLFREQQVNYQEQIQYNQYLRWGIILLAVLASIMLFYAVMRRMFPDAVPPLFMQREIEGGKEGEKKSLSAAKKKALEDAGDMAEGEELETELDEKTDMYRSKLSPEAKRRLKMKSKMFSEIKNFSEFKPDEAASLARSMMVKEDQK